MKRILLTGIMISLLLTIPLMASAEAGFRQDSGKHSSQQQYHESRGHGKAAYHPGNKAHRGEVRRDWKHHNKHYLAQHQVNRYYHEPVRSRVVHRDARTTIIPLPGVVIGFPSVAVRIGW